MPMSIPRFQKKLAHRPVRTGLGTMERLPDQWHFVVAVRVIEAISTNSERMVARKDQIRNVRAELRVQQAQMLRLRNRTVDIAV